MRRVFLGMWCLLCLLVVNVYSQVAPTDMEKAIGLVPETEATCRAVRSGPWSSPATWDNPPAANGFPVIPAGIDIELDESSPRLRKLRIDGALHPKPGADVTLAVDTLVATMTSRIYAGSPEEPFTGRWSIVFADYGPIDTVADPWKFGRGAQLMGEVALHGRPVKAWIPMHGTMTGDSIIRPKTPADGWRVGDQIVVPGTGLAKWVRTTGWQGIDDDEAFIKGFSDDRLMLELDRTLQFPHGDTDRYGGPRPMFVANISQRSIEFRSETSADATRHGHVMVMRDDRMMRQEFRNVSFRHLGRTDKSKPLTDPDGSGGGTANERGRYGLHFHRCGPDRSGMEAVVSGCLFRDSIGWACVNHSSYVCMTDNVSYRAFGAHFVGEVGDETGCMGRNVAVRATSTVVNNLLFRGVAANNDWFKCGHGFATMCGGIRMWDCTATGCPTDCFVLMGAPFGSKPVTKPPILFETKNLLLAPGDTLPSATTIKPTEVPQRHSGLKWFGCHLGINAWGLHGQVVVTPKVGRASLTDCGGECRQSALNMGYLSQLDVIRFRGVRIAEDWGTESKACSHTGSNHAVSYDGLELYDFPFGVYCPASGQQTIKNCKLKCLIGFWVRGEMAEGSYLAERRRIDFVNNVQLPFAEDEWQRVLAGAATGPGSRTSWATFTDRTAPVLYCMGMEDQPGSILSQKYSQTVVPWFCATQIQFDDRTTIDGKYAHFYEQGPDFPLDRIPTLPPILKGLTTGEMWDRHGLAFGGRRCPSGATPLAGSMALVSDNPPIPLSAMTVNQNKKLFHQQTNQTTGYVARVKDASGAFVQSAPTDLTPGWNIVPVTLAGERRGVWVLCDPTKPAINPW